MTKLYTSIQTKIQSPVYDPKQEYHPAPVVSVPVTPVTPVTSEGYYLCDADGYVLTDADGYVLTVKG